MCYRRGDFRAVMSSALSFLLWPLQQLMNGVSWLLENWTLFPNGDRRGQTAGRQGSAGTATALTGHQLPLVRLPYPDTGGACRWLLLAITARPAPEQHRR